MRQKNEVRFRIIRQEKKNIQLKKVEVVRMFQNISRDDIESQNDEIKVNKINIKEVIGRLFAKQNIVLYVISFMISMVRI